MSETAAMFARDAAKKDVHLVNRVPADLSVQADPDRLSQILVNLVDNAVKYTPKGGHVLFLQQQKPATFGSRFRIPARAFRQVNCRASRNGFTGSIKHVPAGKAEPAWASPS